MLRFEWRYHTRRATFVAAALALSLVAAFLVGTGYGPAGVDVNAPSVVAQSLGLMSLFAVFVVTIFCADAALRDAEHGMTEIVYATPVGKPRHLAGRFAGAMLAALTVMAAAALVLMLAPLVLRVEPGRLGPVRPLAYLWALAAIVLPNLLLVGALLFAVATLTRSTLATYVGAVAVYALYLVTALLVESPLMAGAAPPTPEGLARAALLDPFGLSAYFEQTRYWTTPERDTRMVTLGGRLLLNRLLWSGVAAAALALAYARFDFTVAGAARRGARLVPRRAADAAPPPTHAYAPLTPAPAGARSLWLALRSAARLELRHVLRGWTFAALLALWTFVAAMQAVAELGGGEYGTRALPTTGLLLDAMHLPLLMLGTIVIVYYAAEVAWRERVVGFDPLVDASPASSAVFYLAKAGALAALPMLMALVAAGVAIAVQLAHGHRDVQPGLHLTLLWFGGVPLALFAVGALALQALSPNRWLGLLGGLALALVARRGEAVGLEHPMLRFGAAPPVRHSDLDGFGPVPASFAAFMLYWGAAAALLACVSWGAWRRGLDAGVAERLRTLPQRWGRTGTRVAALSAALFVAVAVALFWRTAAGAAWEGSEAGAAWRAGYERAYRRLDAIPQPSVVAVRATVALHPEERRAEIEGTYVLENRTARPLDSVWVTVPRDAERVRITLADAVPAREDARFAVHAFGLRRPLAPGARLDLRFALALDRGGVRAGDFDYDVAENGTYITSAAAFPALGYRAGYELDDPAARRKRGLAGEPSRIPPLAAADSVRAAGPARPWITLDLTVSTAADQTALAPGRLVRSWEGGGRRHFHYVADTPVTPVISIASARYAVRRVRHGDVGVEVWYHPPHAANVRRILDAATRSLDVLAARYGAYGHDALRVVEVPAWAAFGGFAVPGLVFLPEHRGFLADARPGEVDLITRRVAHEVAHQWWGHALDPADVAGASTLVETLAKHSEQLVVEAAHGERALAQMLAFDEDRYFAGRAQDPDGEPSLLEVTDQPYLYYGKGAVVMNGLRGLLGAATVDRALAELLRSRGGPRADATTLDLLDLLRRRAESATDSALVDEWLAGRTVYDLCVDSASAAALPDGTFRLTTRISASKWARRGDAEEPRSADGEPLDVVAYDAHPSTGRVLFAGSYRVADGRIVAAFDLPSRPAFVVVDPLVRRLDRDRGNNRRKLEE